MKFRMVKPFSTTRMPLTKRLAFFFISVGALGAMLTFLPYGYHPVALLGAVSLIIIGLVSAIFADRTSDWRAVVVFSSTAPTFFFSIGARALISQLPQAWIWIALLLACYILAWLIPVLSPKISSLLFKEQMNPQTPMGQALTSFLTRFSSVLIGLGPAAGMYLSRYGYGNVAQLIFGIGMCLAAVLFGQILSHQLWNKRPWIQQDATEKEAI